MQAKLILWTLHSHLLDLAKPNVGQEESNSDAVTADNIHSLQVVKSTPQKKQQFN